MYEEKKAFPIKWIIIGGAGLLLLIIIIAIIANQPNYEQLKKDKISAIEAAGIEYGEEYIKDLEKMEEACVSVSTLIEEGFLESDSKTEKVIYDPTDKSKKTLLDGDVYVYYEDDEVLSEYKYEEKCEIDLSDVISVTETNKTSSGITLTVIVPELINVDTIEMTNVDGSKYVEITGASQTFSELKAGDHTVKIKINTVAGKTDEAYEITKKFTIEKIVQPVVKVDETSSNVVNIKYPSTDTESATYHYYYILNSEDESLAQVVEQKDYKYTFTESGYIIAMVSDGINVVKTDKLNVTVAPVCVDATWSTCAGCSAVCGATCSGTQVSNCGTTRACQVVGACDTTKKYNLTLSVVNGTPASTTVQVENGVSYIFENVKPNSGYVYGSYKCSNGTAVYSSSKSTFIVQNVTTDTTCTITYKKYVQPVTKYTVTFRSGYDQSVITTKSVTSGSTVSSVTPPTISGYVFEYWTLNGTAYNFSSPVKSSITLVAKYSQNKVIVTFNGNGGTPSITYQNVATNGLAMSFTPTRIGYHFMYWTLNSSQYNFATPVTAPITLTAYWIQTKVRNATVSCSTAPCTASYNLSGFTGIHSVTTSSGSVTYTLNGNLITVTLSGSNNANVSITYY